MRMIGITSTAVLTLLLGIAAPVYAQQEQHEQQQEQKERPEKQPENRSPEKEKKAQEKPAQREEKPAQQEEKRAQPEKAQQDKNAPSEKAQQDKNVQREEQHSKPAQKSEPQPQQRAQQKQTPEQQKVERTAWQQHRARSWQSDHRTWQQRGGYTGYRIPDDRFLGYFGPDHGFRIVGLPFLVVGGYPRFQYSGYWFSLVDPWPESWANDWYDTDDVYVAYVDNGYYLFDRRYPSNGIAINISF